MSRQASGYYSGVANICRHSYLASSHRLRVVKPGAQPRREGTADTIASKGRIATRRCSLHEEISMPCTGILAPSVGRRADRRRCRDPRAFPSFRTARGESIVCHFVASVGKEMFTRGEKVGRWKRHGAQAENNSPAA